MSGSAAGLPRVPFAVLYWLLALNAIGVSILLSLLPSVARASRIPDTLIVLAQALSAVAWIVSARYWAAVSRRSGHRAVVLAAAAGAALATFLTASAIFVGTHRLLPPLAALAVLVAGRATYGALGLASAPAAQAFVAERSPPARRAAAIAGIASAQGLGAVIGPALAPLLLVVPMLGLAAPLFILSAVMLASVPLALLLPKESTSDRPGVPGGPKARSLWHVAQVRRYLIYTGLSGLAMFASTQTVSFLVIDTWHLSPTDATPWIARVLVVGAIASLATQALLVPLVRPAPAGMMVAGCLLPIAGCAIFASIPSYGAMLAASAILNAGFALARPGVAAAASLALPADRQAEIAGAQLAVLSLGLVLGPVAGVGLYSVWRPLPFAASILLLLAALGALGRLALSGEVGVPAAVQAADPDAPRY